MQQLELRMISYPVYILSLLVLDDISALHDHLTIITNIHCLSRESTNLGIFWGDFVFQFIFRVHIVCYFIESRAQVACICNDMLYIYHYYHNDDVIYNML